MSQVHGFLTALAVLIVIGFGIERAYQTYQAWQYSRAHAETDIEYPEEESEPKVPATGVAELSVFHAALGEEILDFDSETDAAVIPVFLKTGKFSISNELKLGTNEVSEETEFLNSCEDTPMVNVAHYTLATNKLNLAFENRVYLPSIGALRTSIGDTIVIFAVERDSNADGYLTCADEAELLIFDADEPRIFRTGVKFNAESTAIRLVDDRTLMATLNSPGSDDLEEARIYSIDLESGTAKELQIPELKPAAQKAFEGISE